MSSLTIDLVRAELDDRRREARAPRVPARGRRHRVPRRRSLHLPRPWLRPLGLS
jgi:hypothetical protein